MPRTARITAVALLAWALANALVLFFGRLPAGRQLADLNLRAAEALLIIVLVRVLTRRRPANPSSQAPADHATARSETLWLIAYGGERSGRRAFAGQGDGLAPLQPAPRRIGRRNA